MDDLISRQAAIDALNVCVTIGRGCGKSVTFDIVMATANYYADIVKKKNRSTAVRTARSHSV